MLGAASDEMGPEWLSPGSTPQRHTIRLPRIRFRRFPKRNLTEWTFLISLCLYTLICLGIFFQYVQPWTAGNSNIRIGADSDRFWEFANDADQVVFFSPTQNLLGPVALAMILKSGLGVMVCNFALLLIAIKIAFSIPNINKGLFGFLLLLNAELIPALTTLNKEIFALLGAVMTVRYFVSRSKLLLLATLFVLACARWEAVAFLLLYLSAARLGFRNRPKTLLVMIILAITVLYPFAFKIAGVDPHSFDYLLEGSNTIIRLNSIQDAFGFPLVILPKALMLIGGGWVSPRFYTENIVFQSGFDDYQQGIFQPLGCLMFMGIFMWALRSGRLRLSRPIAMLSFITILATEAAPFIQSRYLFGVYVMLCVEVARPAEPGTGPENNESRLSPVGDWH